MGLMGAAFHWKPDDFWRATPHEVIAIMEAHAEVHSTEGEV